jgi:hypothetical protein
VLIPLLERGERGVVHDRHCRAGDAVCSKVREQLLQRRATAALSPPPRRGLVEKRVGHLLVHIGECHVVIGDPAIESPNQ